MNNFSLIIQKMNLKRATYAKTYLDRVVEVQRRINNRNIVALGQYTLYQKREGYVIVQHAQQVPPQGRPRPDSPSIASALKRQNLEQ